MLVQNSALVNISETKFLLLEISIARNQLISYMLSQRNQFLGLRLFPERCGKLSTSSLNHRTMSVSFAPNIASCMTMNTQICLEEPAREEIPSLTTLEEITLKPSSNNCFHRKDVTQVHQLHLYMAVLLCQKFCYTA